MAVPLEEREIEFLSPRGRRLSQLSYGRSCTIGGLFERLGPAARQVPRLRRARSTHKVSPLYDGSSHGRRETPRWVQSAQIVVRDGKEALEAAPAVPRSAPVPGRSGVPENVDIGRTVMDLPLTDPLLCVPWNNTRGAVRPTSPIVSTPEGQLLRLIDSPAARLAEEIIASENDQMDGLVQSSSPSQIADAAGFRKEAAHASAGRLARVFEEGKRQGEMALVERLRDLEETHDAEMRSATEAVQQYEAEILTERAREQRELELEMKKREEDAARQAHEALRAQQTAEVARQEAQRQQAIEAERQRTTVDRRASLDAAAAASVRPRHSRPQVENRSRPGIHTDAEKAAAPFLSVLAEAGHASEAVKADRSLAVGRMMLLKSIQTAITQISATEAQVQAKIAELNRALQSARNSALYDFAMLRTAQKLVAQADSQVYLHPSSAYPVAAVGLALCADHARLHKMLLGCLYGSCPYLIPVSTSLAAGERKEEYLKRMGWAFVDAKPETLEAHYDRMSGFVMLFAALVQTPFRPHAGSSHPFGVDLGWMWLSRVVNSEPSRITSLLLVSFLEIAGYRMALVYGAQFRKLMQLLVGPYAARLPKSSSGSNARLGICVGKLLELPVAPPEGWSSYLL